MDLGEGYFLSKVLTTVKKKWVFLSLVFLVIIILIGSAWLYREHRIKVAEKKLEQKIDNLVKENSNVSFRKIKQKYKKVKIITYIPITKDKQDNQLVKEKMRIQIKRDRKKIDRGLNKPHYYFYVFKEQSASKNTDSFRMEKHSYKRVGFHIVEASHPKRIQTLTVDEKTNDLLTLQTIFKHSFYKSTAFKRIVMETAIRAGNLKIENGEDIAFIKYPHTSKAFNFRLTNDTLTIPVKIPHVKKMRQVSIPLATIATHLKRKYVNKQMKEYTTSVSKKRIALTFDDGPSNVYTPKVLKILHKYHAKATFFVVGSSVKKYPQIVKREIKEGHQVGNHSYDHPLLTKLSAKQVAQQIWGTEIAVYRATGYFPEIVRPPYGGVDRKTAKTAGLPIIQWTVDTLDWKARSPQGVTNAVMANANDGAIVLMHDIHEKTADSLDETLRLLKKCGYKFVTVNELLKQNLHANHQYFSASNQRKITN